LFNPGMVIMLVEKIFNFNIPTAHSLRILAREVQGFTPAHTACCYIRP
jgi:hypothetical protein